MLKPRHISFTALVKDDTLVFLFFIFRLMLSKFAVLTTIESILSLINHFKDFDITLAYVHSVLVSFAKLVLLQA